MKFIHLLSLKIRHWFHVLSNIRPVVWIGLYVLLIPVFACIYWILPEGQFRIPYGGETDFGSWLYYSIVTITTLGFGDYTPAQGMAQWVTAIEVLCGVLLLGFFLNAVGSMKSEIDIESAAEKQRLLHQRQQTDILRRNIPSIIHTLNTYLSYCYAVTTPLSKRTGENAEYNPDFTFADMADLYRPSGLPSDRTHLPAVTRLLHSAAQTSLALDSLQNRVDLALWPQALEDCFGFVAAYQMFASTDALTDKHASDATRTAETSLEIAAWQGKPDFESHPELQPIGELYYFIKKSADYALRLEATLTSVASTSQQ